MIVSFSKLPSSPLGFFPRLRIRQNAHNLFQRRQPLIQCLVYFAPLVGSAELLVEVGLVRRSSHCGAENGFDEERVMLRQGLGVGVFKGG